MFYLISLHDTVFLNKILDIFAKGLIECVEYSFGITIPDGTLRVAEGALAKLKLFLDICPDWENVFFSGHTIHHNRTFLLEVTTQHAKHLHLELEHSNMCGVIQDCKR